MKRQRLNALQERRLQVQERLGQFQTLAALVTRASFASGLGAQYQDYRKLYKALGYPDDMNLTFDYYWNKYDRQDIATAVIDKPVEATWRGTLKLMGPDEREADSKLLKAWAALNEKLKIKQILTRADKLAGIGHYAVLLLGFSDVKNTEDYKKPLGGGSLKLLYVRPYAENAASITEWVTDSSNERYGLPLFYDIQMDRPGDKAHRSKPTTTAIRVHWSRVIHLTDVRLLSDVIGRPRLKPIVNRLEDLEKLMGGDAEMFWRGARPGYHAKPQPEYQFSESEIVQLEDELDKFEHDLRRVMATEGVEEFKALAQQIADPKNHVEIQIQAIAAQTNIPKRILVGSERGELSSSQDTDQWLSQVATRREEYAEPYILRPFIDVLMEHNILPKTAEYNVGWEDLFAPSEEDKAKVGEIRARALKSYVDAVGADEILPRQLAYKHLFGLNDEQVDEAMEASDAAAIEEDRIMAEAEEMAGQMAEEEVARRTAEIAGRVPPGQGNGNGRPPQQRQRNGQPPNQR